MMFDLLSKGDLLINEFFAFEDLIGERLMLRTDELFSVRSLEDASLLDLKNSKAGVVAFFLED